jgi:serine protease AprX
LKEYPVKLRTTGKRGVRALLTATAALGIFAAPTAASAAVTGSGSTGGGPTAQPASGKAAKGPHGARWRFDASAATLPEIGRVIGADSLWSAGITGSGVGVALVDSGVAPVSGLTSRNIVNGPDLSLDSQDADVLHRDTYGHGTHLAGIIAGNDPATGFRGIAPDARLTSVKVAADGGVVDVSQVIAAVDWVVEHRNDDPEHPIRVLNLAYGTDGVQDYQVDPLTHAVENAWRAGIVVVVAAGNGGTTDPQLTNPARDPYVLAVGANDTAGTPRTSDDVVSDFSSRGDDTRRVDLVAPGRSIVSLRAIGSDADLDFPSARVGDTQFKGSGTSQAGAVVSGAVALLLQQHPGLTPDAVKATLVQNAARLPGADADAQGAGELQLTKANRPARGQVTQTWPRSIGTGSLEAARGSAHVSDDGVDLSGENDIFGTFNVARWAAASSAHTAWNGGNWMGRDWTGESWIAEGWTDSSWSSHTWSSHTWSGYTWSSHTWSGYTWSSHTWSGYTWSSHTWSGYTWSGDSWS